MQYHKLVRDRIPEIIAQAGRSCRVRTLKEDEFFSQLSAKLQEEMTEYLAATTPQAQMEELADMLEVMRYLVKACGYAWQDLESRRQLKYAERGGFEQRIYLIDADE